MNVRGNRFGNNQGLLIVGLLFAGLMILYPASQLHKSNSAGPDASANAVTEKQRYWHDYADGNFVRFHAWEPGTKAPIEDGVYYISNFNPVDHTFDLSDRITERFDDGSFRLNQIGHYSTDMMSEWSDIMRIEVIGGKSDNPEFVRVWNYFFGPRPESTIQPAK